MEDTPLPYHYARNKISLGSLCHVVQRDSQGSCSTHCLITCMSLILLLNVRSKGCMENVALKQYQYNLNCQCLISLVQLAVIAVLCEKKSYFRELSSSTVTKSNIET